MPILRATHLRLSRGRSAAIASMAVACRAANQQASNPANTTTAATVMYATGSRGFQTSMKRWNHPAQRYVTVETDHRGDQHHHRAGYESQDVAALCDQARAMRMPNSCVRCATVYETTLYSPVVANSRAAAAKMAAYSVFETTPAGLQSESDVSAGVFQLGGGSRMARRTRIAPPVFSSSRS
jgi:hypothetical protein